ncbi:MAG TPA: MBL fold metallo-hydrolase [Dehalococcoidales bacterium]|nr:MBL fold metallo-hydrolase [Dehalococcoidales bacterium]
MKELYPGVFQIKIGLQGFGPGAVNLYVIQDGSHLTLIDTGWDLPESIGHLQEQLAEKGFALQDIQRVLVTHCHSDHLGLINRLHEENRAQIYLHQKEQDIISARYNPRNDYWPNTDLFLMTHGIPSAELALIEDPLPQIQYLAEPDVWLKGDEVISVGEYKLKAVNTPGHSPGHTAYYEPYHKFLFSGDILLPTISTNAATHVQHMVNPLQQYLDTLQRLNELDVSSVLPGHEYPFSGHRQRITELVDHHNARSQAVQQIFQGHFELMNAYQVARLLEWTTRNRKLTWEQLKPWDKRLAMMQSVAHLELLVFSQKLLRLSQNGKIFYHNPASCRLSI